LSHKSIEGFNLLKYLQEKLSKEKVQEFMNFIRDDFDKNPHSGSIFSSKRTYAVKAGDTQIFSLE
jgi:hypothetical protein